jgi:hypothetical protein
MRTNRQTRFILFFYFEVSASLSIMLSLGGVEAGSFMLVILEL